MLQTVCLDEKEHEVSILRGFMQIKNAISDILSKSLNAENFYETRDIAKMYDLQTVLKCCKIYYEEYFMAISLQPGFQNEKITDLISILKSENLKLSEEEKLMVSLRWVEGYPSKKENILELVKLINLKDVSSEYLSDILVNDPVIGNDFRLYRLITTSCIEKAIKKCDNKKDSDKKQIVVFDHAADCLQLYDLETGDLTVFHNEKFKHLMYFTAVTMDSYIYVLCDYKSVHRLNFRDKNSKWERMQNMIADHGVFPPVVSLSGSLFVIGSHFIATRDVEIFIPAANRWLRLNSQPQAVHCESLLSLDNSIFCIGRSRGSEVLNSFLRFTPSRSEWVDLEPMKNMYDCVCCAVAVKQRIFVIAKMRNSETVNEGECYDVNSKRWTSLTHMISPHSYAMAHHIDGWIFVLPHEEDIPSQEGAEKYNISNDRWYRVEFKEVKQFRVFDSVSIQI